MMNSDTYEVNKELKDIAPILAELPKNSASEVPTGYFQLVEEQIMGQIFISENVHKSEMQVPEGYFEKLESDVINVVSKNNPNKSSEVKIVLFSNVKLLQYAAAAVLILFVSVWIEFNVNNTNAITEDTTLETSDAYFEYLEDNMDEFDINSLVDHDLIEESDITLITYTEDAVTDDSQYFILESEINF